MPDSLPDIVPNPWIAGLLDGLRSPPVDPLAELEIGRVTPADLERFEILDDLAREEDDDAARRGVPGTGPDLMGMTARRLMVLPSDAEPDPLALMRTDLPVVRMGRRPLGEDFAKARPVEADTPMPFPKGMAPAEPVSGQAWRRRSLPAEGWTCLGLRLSDGVEGCGYCARGLRRSSRLAVLAHHAHDLMLSACLDCGDQLVGRPVADRNEDETPIPFALPPDSAALRDPSLWKADWDGQRMSLDLSEDFQVRLMWSKSGVAVEIDFPDLAGETTVIGTYRAFELALYAAIFTIDEWKSR